MSKEPSRSIDLELFKAGYILANGVLHIDKRGRIKFDTVTIERIFKEASCFVKDGHNYKLILQEQGEIK